MVLRLTIKKARMEYPKYDDYPNISKTGSLRGMYKLYGWKPYYVIQVGGYYYHLRGHPIMEADVKRLREQGLIRR